MVKPSLFEDGRIEIGLNLVNELSPDVAHLLNNAYGTVFLIRPQHRNLSERL